MANVRSDARHAGQPRFVRAGRTLPLALALAPAFLAGCGDPSGPGPPTGAVRVSVTTTGVDADPDGYQLVVDTDDIAPLPIGASAERTILGLGAGEHTITVRGVASNCAIDGANPQTVGVVAGATATASFRVTCVARGGSVRVTTVTTGSEIDPDGYTVRVMSLIPWWYYYHGAIATAAIGANAAVTLPVVPMGTYSVDLGGVASNCTITTAPTDSIEITQGGTVDVAFTVRCAAAGS